MRMVLRMKWQNIVLLAEIPCEWTFGALRARKVLENKFVSILAP